jgi:hypothetical protein
MQSPESNNVRQTLLIVFVYSVEARLSSSPPPYVLLIPLN